MDDSRPADHWRIGKDNTALIVVDMQNMWVDPRGTRYLPSSEDIIPKIQELLDVCRSSDVPVIYLSTPPSVRTWRTWACSPISSR